MVTFIGFSKSVTAGYIKKSAFITYSSDISLPSTGLPETDTENETCLFRNRTKVLLLQEIIDMCDFAVGLSRQLNGSIIPSERKLNILLVFQN